VLVGVAVSQGKNGLMVTAQHGQKVTCTVAKSNTPSALEINMDNQIPSMDTLLGLHSKTGIVPVLYGRVYSVTGSSPRCRTITLRLPDLDGASITVKVFGCEVATDGIALPVWPITPGAYLLCFNLCRSDDNYGNMQFKLTSQGAMFDALDKVHHVHPTTNIPTTLVSTITVHSVVVVLHTQRRDYTMCSVVIELRTCRQPPAGDRLCGWSRTNHRWKVLRPY
jgi:hypothetical protein